MEASEHIQAPDEAVAAPARVRDYAALAARIRALPQPPLAVQVYGQQTSPAAPGEAYDLFLVRVPARPGARRARFNVMINGGTHGDEPAGAEAVVRFLETRRYAAWPEVAFTVTPCTNPWGYVHDTREVPGGIDLNRAFRRATPHTPQVTLLKRALRRQAFDLFLDCHEDVDAPGLYVFAPEALGRTIVDAVRRLGPIHEGDLVDGEIPLDGGVVVLDSLRSRQRRNAWRTWPLPLYIARYHHRLSPAQRLAAGAEISLAASATIETPTRLPMEQRIAMHLAAIDAALATLAAK